MSHLFELKDKRGRLIHLSFERWNHIVSEHPDLSNKLEEVKETINNPLIIKPSRYYQGVCFYYKYFKPIAKYLLVSVKYLNGTGFIITRFYVKRLRK